ncbi:MAG: hypothetical protein K9L82_20380 [Chromatiaceae bacterium]|nr:hypothetical protein [Chromatiaceae bacterium]
MLRDESTAVRLDNRVVIMVGGKGLRLRPLTAETPKPMRPIADKPLLEVIVRQLAAQGFHRFIFALHYKFEQIQAHFGDGSALGCASTTYLSSSRLAPRVRLACCARRWSSRSSSPMAIC